MTALILTFFKQFKFTLVASILIALAVLFYAQIRKARNEGVEIGRSQIQKKWDEERDALRLKIEKAEIENRKLKEARNDALHQARDARAQASQRDANDVAHLIVERDKLRRSLTRALDTIRACNVSETSKNARADTSSTIAAVFDDMEREGEEMARAASGHAADSLMYQQAWPK